MNGSFVIPARFIRQHSMEKIWLLHSFVGIGIIPWVILSFLLPDTLTQYNALPFSTLILIACGGIIFGIGQVFFAYAIDQIGIALAFTINLSLGVTIGSLFVAAYKGILFHTSGIFIIMAIFLIIGSLLLHYKISEKKLVATQHHWGWIFAFFTGLTSGLQNSIFVVVAFNGPTRFGFNSFWMWPPFLFFAAIPMIIGFYYRAKHKVVNQTIDNSLPELIRKGLLIILMGCLFSGSLALYSTGMNLLSHQQQVVGWPMFMLAIIFTSQAWGLWHDQASMRVVKYRYTYVISFVLLFIALILLALDMI